MPIVVRLKFVKRIHWSQKICNKFPIFFFKWSTMTESWHIKKKKKKFGNQKVRSEKIEGDAKRKKFFSQLGKPKSIWQQRLRSDLSRCWNPLENRKESEQHLSMGSVLFCANRRTRQGQSHSGRAYIFFLPTPANRRLAETPPNGSSRWTQTKAAKKRGRGEGGGRERKERKGGKEGERKEGPLGSNNRNKHLLHGPQVVIYCVHRERKGHSQNREHLASLIFLNFRLPEGRCSELEWPIITMIIITFFHQFWVEAKVNQKIKKLMIIGGRFFLSLSFKKKIKKYWSPEEKLNCRRRYQNFFYF